LEGIGHCLNPYSPNLRGKTQRKKMKILGLDRLCPTRDPDWRPSEYKHGVVVLCCILRGPEKERILHIVPGGTELGTQVTTGSWADRTHSK